MQSALSLEASIYNNLFFSPEALRRVMIRIDENRMEQKMGVAPEPQFFHGHSFLDQVSDASKESQYIQVSEDREQAILPQTPENLTRKETVLKQYSKSVQVVSMELSHI